MKIIAVLYINICMSISINAQNDSNNSIEISMAERNACIRGCLKNIEKRIPQLIDLEKKKMCNCLCDSLINVLSDSNFNKVAEDHIAEFLSQEEYLSKINHCLDSNISIFNNLKFKKVKGRKLENLAIENCVTNHLNDKEIMKVYTIKHIKEYCTCMITKLYSSDYSMKDIEKIEDENSQIYKKIVLPCTEEVFDSAIDNETKK